MVKKVIILTIFRMAWASFKYHKRFHFFFCLSLSLIFTLLFFMQAIALSLDLIEEQFGNQQVLTDIPNLFMQNYQSFIQNGQLVVLFLLALLIGSKEWGRKKEYLVWLNNSGRARRLFAVQLIESCFLLLSASLLFLFILVLFVPTFKFEIIRLHQIIISQSPTLNAELEVLVKTESSNQLNLHFMSFNQMIEHIFFTNNNQWFRILLQAYGYSFLWLTKYFLLIHTVATCSNIFGRKFYWKNKKNSNL